MIVVLTEEVDLTTDLVARALGRQNTEFVRINADRFLDAAAITARFPDARAEIRIGARTLDLRQPLTIWNRRPTLPKVPTGVPAGDAAFAAREGWAALQGALMQADARWVNHPNANALANSKLAQLRRAVACGLAVPRTLVTNEPDEAIAFRASCAHGCVAKPLSHGHIEGPDGTDFAIYTSRVSDDTGALEAVRVCPVLLQEEVPRGFDVRLTVIGSKQIAMRIAWDHGATVDWRTEGADASLRYDRVPVPIDVAAPLAAFHASFGLVFGAYDFIVSPDGRWHFLEVNPMGQWGWLHGVDDVQLAEEFAALLVEVDRAS